MPCLLAFSSPSALPTLLPLPACRALKRYGLAGTLPSPAGWDLPPALQIFQLGENAVGGSLPAALALPANLTAFSL